MAFTVFPPTSFESTDEGQLAGNEVVRQHLTVRGSLSVGRDMNGATVSDTNVASGSLSVPKTTDIPTKGNTVISSLTEELTLNTGGATTDSTANLLPATSFILGVAFRVTETINTATAYSIGDPTTAARFQATGSALTAGTTGVGMAHLSGASTTLANGPSQVAAAKLRITTSGGQNTTGKVRVTVFYIQFAAPTTT